MGKDTRQKRGRKTVEDADKGREEAVETQAETAVRWSRVQLSVTGVLAGVYVATMHRSLPGGDAGELIVAADQLGVAHPPGYPLYTLLLKLSFLLIPNGTVAFKANLITSLLAAAAGGYLFQAVFLLTGSLAGSLLAAGLFSLSRLTWTWSVGAEVFALNNLLLAVLMLTAVLFSQASPDRKAKVSLLGAFVCGLCLSNQHTSVIYVGVLAVWVLHTLFKDKVLTFKLLVCIAVSFLAGLLPYIYLPISAWSRSAKWTWGDQSTVSGFLTHLLRSEYGTLSLLKNHEGQGFIQGLLAYMEHVTVDLTPAALFLFAMVVFSSYKRKRQDRELLVVFLLMLLLYAVFFAWRANLDINSPLFLGVVERFWMQSDIVLVFLAAVAFSDIIRLLDQLVPLQKWKLDVIIAVVFVCVQMKQHFATCDQSNNFMVRDFAMATLKAFPEGAIVLTKGDLPSTSLRYFHVSEGVRPDLVIVDQEVLTYNWSIPMMGHHLTGLVLPGDQLYSRSGLSSQGRKLFTFKQLLDANYDRKPLYGCVGVQDHEHSWQQSYELRPFGVCMQFIKRGMDLEADMKEWLEANNNIAKDWQYPIPKHDATWDDVASSEMWRAKTMAGFFLLENVDKLASDQKKAVWLKKAYEIYDTAITSYPQTPSYWHKNFALVCEKLRHASPQSDSLPLIKKSIKHFKIYLERDFEDPQRDAIKNAISSFEAYVAEVEGSQR